MLSTAQQVWLRKLGGAKPVVNESGSGIISAGRAKRSSFQPSEAGSRLVFLFSSFSYFSEKLAFYVVKSKFTDNRGLKCEIGLSS